MSLFSNLLNNTMSPTLISDPCKPYINDNRQEYRKKEENFAEKVHPKLGKIVRQKNNIQDTIENFEDSINNGVIRSLFSPELNHLNEGDHLFVQRCGYTHHGIYVGYDRVIHYLGECVKEDLLETFANGAKIHKKSPDESPIKYTVDIVLKRAYSRVGEDNYNLIINNCENFVRWCRAGGEEFNTI